MGVHPVFHVFQLEKVITNEFTEEYIQYAPVKVNDNEEFYVETILDSKYRYNKLHYLVHWLGYDESFRTWEKAENCSNSPDAIRLFHTRYPDKPKEIILSRTPARQGI